MSVLMVVISCGDAAFGLAAIRLLFLKEKWDVYGKFGAAAMGTLFLFSAALLAVAAWR